MRSLNLDQLRALMEVVEQGSFSEAARRLHLSQPAVSLQVRELERRLGVRLVERLGKRAYATAAGSELMEHARRLGTAADRAIAAMRRYRDGWLGRVRIGTGTTALSYLLPPLIRDLREKHPDIELVVLTGTTTGVVERMVRNVIDIGLVTLPVDERVFDVLPLREEELVAILPARKRPIPAEVTPEEIARLPLIVEYSRANLHKLILDWATVNGEPPRPAMELDNLEAIKHFVAAGLGVSIMPMIAVTGAAAVPDVVLRPLRPKLARTIGLIQRRDKADDPALRVVREALLTLGKSAPGARSPDKRPLRTRGR